MSQFDDILAKHGIQSQKAQDPFDAILKKHGIVEAEAKQGFFSNVADLAVGGAKSALTAARLSGDVATGNFDQNAAGLINQSLQEGQKPKPAEMAQVEQAFAGPAQEYQQAGDWADNPLGKLAAIGKTIWTVGEQAVTNPKGTAYLTASQIANMAPSIAGMMAGAKAGAVGGSVFGPVGAGVGAVGGGVAGGFAGEWPMEAGSEFIGAVGKELQKRGMANTEQNVAALLADKRFMDSALSDVRTKATTTSAVDAAFTLGAGRLATGPARAAEKAARAELGAAATANQIAERTKEILKKRTLPQKVGTGTKAVGLDVVGGGASEAAGQYAGYGNVDMADVGMEMLGELGGAGIEVPAAAWSAGRNLVKPDGTSTPAPQTQGGTQGGTMPPPAAPAPKPTEAEKALAEIKPITALDRVGEIESEDANLAARLKTLNDPANGYGPMFDTERQEIFSKRMDLANERDGITKTWPKFTPGIDTDFSTEAGARLKARYALAEADDLTASHDENLRPSPTFPKELQPRERDRAASEMQVSSIVQKLDPARLGVAADAATGAPIVGADGLVESGNARTIALKRVYQANGQKAEDYRTFLKTNAAQFGFAPEQVDGMKRPVLVRVRSTPVDRAEFARQANAATVAQMSPSEQARADAARIDNLDDLNPDENGDFTSGSSRDFVRGFMGRLPQTEQSGMIDAGGALSQSGYTRMRNAILAKAYGDSPVLLRLVESLNEDGRNLSRALMQAAPKVAKARSAIQAGALFDADITPDLMAAVEELSRLKDAGTSVDDALAQSGMFGEKLTPEAKAMVRFLADNARRPRRIADFIQAYVDALTAAGSPAQGSLLGETKAPAKADLMRAAYRETVGLDAREEADRKWNEALADLGVIARNLAGVQRMLPEDTPNLMPTLVKLFDAGIAKVGTNFKDLLRYVKDALKGMPEFKPLWNKITDETYRKAAQQAINAKEEKGAAKPEQVAEKAGKAKSQESGAANVAMIGGRAYDMKRDNFKAPKPDEFLPAAIIEEADNYIAKYFKDRQPTQISAEDRARAEALLSPVMEKAAAAKVDYDQRIIDIAERTGAIGQMLAPLKGMERAAVKLAVEENFDVSGMKDLLRSTIVVNRYAEAQAVLDEIGKSFDILRIKNRSEASLTGKNLKDEPRAKLGGYADVLVNVVMPNGVIAEIQINTPEMLSAKEAQGHKLYEVARDFPEGSAMRAEVNGAMRGFYDAAFAAAGGVSRTQMPPSGPDFMSGRGESSAPSSENLNQAPSGNRTNSSPPTVGTNVQPGGNFSGAFMGSPSENNVPQGGAESYTVGKQGGQDDNAESRKSRTQGQEPDAVPQAGGERGTQRVRDNQGGGDLRRGGVDDYGTAPQGEVGQARATGGRGEGASSQRAEPGDRTGRDAGVPDGRLTPDEKLREALDELGAVIRQAVSKMGGVRMFNEEERARILPALVKVLEALYEKGVRSAKAMLSQAQAMLKKHEDPFVRSNWNKLTQADYATAAQQAIDNVEARDQQGDLFAAASKPPKQSGFDFNKPEATPPAPTEKPDTTEKPAPKPRPAGRDIPPKTGRNFMFGDNDLTYEGSWQKKAEQNVEAVELLKRLEADGRQATRDEQSVLAKFIGWGASEIANTLFGDKLDAAVKAEEAYAVASKAMDEAGRDYLAPSRRVNYRWESGDPNFMDAFRVIQYASPDASNYNYEKITRAELDKARPAPVVRRWIALRDRLQAALTEQEWAEASRSTQYAHYTSKPIVKAMWRGMARMGFKGGHILEPGAGIGVFPGLMPSEMAHNSSYTGIEFDSITGGILKQLYPDERILVESFVDTKLPANFFTVAAGNPPFGKTAILADPRYRKLGFALHDFFFAKTLDSVQPGGLTMFVTSRYTMDKLNDKARAWMAERADLVGAIRLPQTAFQKNAGTEVVTDVLFLRKKVPGEVFEHGQAWGKSVPITVNGNQYNINEYFVAHPEMVLGKHADTGSMYKDREYTVEPMEGDIEAQFDKAVENLPENILRVERGSAAEAAKVREIDWDPKAKKEGNYYVTDAGVLMQLEGGVGVRVELKNEKDVALLKDFVAVRDALKQAHLDQLNDGEWETSLAALQKAYRAFVAKYGRVLQFKEYKRTLKTEDEETGETFEDERTFRRFPLLAKLDDDPDYTRVMALENLNDETGEITDSQFLLERVLGKPLQAEIRTPQDALLSVLNDVGKVDLELIAGRLGMTDADVLNALGTAIYQDPSVGWVMADEYLSGNVKRKLDDAIAAARSDRRYERNVEALREAQPLPKVASDIVPQLGMAWIPMEVYEQFLFDKAGVKVKVAYNKAANTWAVEEQRGGLRNLQATTDWGTGHRPAHEILAHALNGNPIRITTKDNDGNTISLEDATELANQKLEQMRQAFSDWLWTDATRTNELVNIYNDRFNTIVPRKFDGQHLTLPGASAAWQKQVHPHVKRGVWRIIQSGNTYLAHAVGSGKTAQMVMSAMEQKRLGLIKKPMIVVPNHMLQQMSKEWLEIYPAAKLMVADEKNFHTENRRRWVSRVSMSDVDAVVITHSAFKLLDLDPEFKRKLVEQELTYLRAAYEDAGGDLKSLTLETEVSKKGVKTVKVKSKGQRSPTIKRIEQLIEAMEQQLQEAMSSAGKDANVRFDELGVDMLYVDEAHEFRKLAFSTRRQVKGVDPAGSKRAFDLWIKTRWLKEKNPNRYLVLASGTPVTNTMAELYSVQKLMDYDTLEAAGLEDFDSWASQFGAESTALEQTVGGGYKPETRFNKFVNVGELIQMFRQFADVLTSDHLAALLGDKRPKVEGGGRKLMVSPKTDLYTAFLKQELEPRMVASRAWKPSKDQPNNPDPIIKIIGDGRLAAIDMRFMHPELPNDPDSKLNRMIDGVIRVYKETGDIEYTDRAGKPEPIKGAAQMVFSDLGFGAGVTEHRGFNARAWFEKRLRDAGIPPAQVAFMSYYKKSDAKLKLFKDVNAGRVRILVGSSKNMGTGVNAQQRLIAMHHLDAPWYPADLEQREGRIIRQGNKNKVVQVYAHAMKGTYDEQMWATLARKQFFIDQALSGDVNVREIEDVSEVSNLQQASAMLADDPRLMEAAGLKADIEKLERLYRAHEESRARMYQAYNLAGELIRTSEPRLAEVEKQAARVQQDLTGDKFKAKADGQTFDKRKEWGEAIIRQARALVAKFQEGRVEIGSISGFPVVYRGEVRRSDLAGVEYRMSLTLQDVPEGAVPLAYDVGESVDPVGMSMRATNALADVVRAPERMRAAIADARSRQDALAGRLDAPFQFAQTLADKRAELVRLEEDIAANAGAQQRWILRNKVTGDSVGNIAAENERAAKLKMIPWRKFSDALLDQWEAVQIDPATGLPVVASEPVAGGKLFGIEFLNPTTMLSRGYTGRDAYTQDLFGNPLPDQTRKSRGGKPAPAAKTGNVPSNTPVPAGRYGTTTKLVAHARRDIGARKVTTVDEAATALSYLGRGAVERFDALVTDKDGNPLALVGSFKGALTQTAVYPATIAAEAFRIQGAAHIWFAHNHPGGTPELSQADRWLMNQLEIVFRGTGIQTHGLLALTQEGLYGHTNEGKGKIQPAAGEAFTVDAVEREFDQYGKLGPSLSDPARARQVVPTVANNETGLVLLDSQNQPIAFVPMKPSEALPLKDNGRLDALYRAMSYANAAGAILHDPKGKFTEEQYRNVGSALALIDVKMLDVLQAGGVSLAEKGKSLAGTVVLSRDGTPGIALRDLNAVVARVGKANANLPPVHVLTSPMALDLNNPSQARLREFIENAGALDDVEGAAHEGEIYLFASGLADEARAEHVLATHEVTHYGLRAVFGMELDTVLQSIWATNANIRKRAAALREKLGLASNVAAVEEILADMEPGELVKLNGWRRLVQTLRDWFRAHGFTALADRLDSLMKAGMSEQRKADLLVAEVVTAARDWVKGGKRAGKVASGTVLADARKLSEDLPAQEKWLNTEARARGFKNIDDLAAKDYKVFENLAALWRKKHPAAVMLSRTQPASEETPIKLDGLWTVNAAPKVGEKFIVYRFGNASGELAGRNAGNSWGVVYYIMTQEDYDRPSNGPLGTHIHAYEVEVSKPFGSYVGITRGGNTRDVQTGAPVGRTVNGGGVAYSFERDGAWKAKTLGYVTMDQVRQAIIDRTDGQYSDFDGTGTVIGMEVLNSLFADKIAKAEGFETPRLSRAAAQQTPQPVAARADAILADSTAKWRPVEAIVKAGVQLTRFDRATSALYAKAGHLLDVLTPEKVKAGVVADYGIPGAVLDQRAMMAGRKRVQLRKSEQLIEKLATLTREESRVAYEWLNNDDGQAAAWFESQLPAESVQVLNDVRAMIDELSQEAVRLGQLDAETFKRHRFAYLRRSYAKHVEEMTKRDLVKRQRAIAILGDQYKGRGITEATTMKQVQNIAPEWWKRKTQAGKADKALKGEKFIRLEKRKNTGAGTVPLAGMTGRPDGRLLAVAYWPAGEPIPARLKDWNENGTWEVRDIQGDKLVLWRDFTKAERVSMGEIDEARFAIARTLHGMINDIETGRYLNWLAERFGEIDPARVTGPVVEASERMRDSFAADEWVKVPDTKIPSTNVLKYGKLAGRYLPGPIWNDVRQSVGGRFQPLGETYAAILSAWKTSKTALSPAVHTNNIMANLVMADWHDVGAGHMLKALRILLAAGDRDGKGILGNVGNAASRAGVSDREAAREILNRFLDSGGGIGTWITQEIQKEQMLPLLEALENELRLTGQNQANQIGVMAALQHLLHLRFSDAWGAFAGSKPGKPIVQEARNLIQLYEAEDQVFRLAAWLKAKEEGITDLEAGKAARKSFLDYHINAPWIQAMRQTAFPFIAFTYRAMPMLMDIAAHKPWKLMKLALIAGSLNALGYALSGGDEDDERKPLPDEKAGSIWGLVPKLIRMPWNDKNGSPVFLDVRRFVPVGDIFDTGQTHTALPVPPAMVPGGPLALLGELAMNKQQFTGKAITLDTDTGAEAAGKVFDHLYKAFAPNLVFLPGTYAWTGVSDSLKGKTDSFGREMTPAMSMATAFGVKVGAYPTNQLRLNAMRAAQAKNMEIDRNIQVLKRQLATKGITPEDFQEKVQDQQEKKRQVLEDLREKAQ